MLGNGNDRRADEHQVHALGHRPAVALEELEQLAAALVLVDPADVDREPVAEIELLAKARGAGLVREWPTRHPTTTPGTSVLPETPLMSARSSNELYISARTPRNTGAKMLSPSAPSRSAVGTRIALPGTARAPWNEW